MSSQTHTFRIEGMHCGSCALLIDEALADLDGVIASQTSMKQNRSVVELDSAPGRVREVIVTIEELGYTATPLT